MRTLFKHFAFLRLLTQKWTNSKAYKLGLIDDKGKTIKSAETTEEKQAYTIFHRLVYNLKRLLNKIPFGRSTIASYAAALFLLKEETGLSERLLGECLFETLGYNPYEDPLLSESYSILAPGDYIIKGEVYLENGKCINMSYHNLSISESVSPNSYIFGVPVFKVICKKIKRPILLTTENLIPNE